MEIEETTEYRGINPKNIDQPVTGTLEGVESLDGDCVEEEKRKPKKGDGKFRQYTLHLNVNGEHRVSRYHFLRDLQSLRRAYGANSKTWVGKQLVLYPEQDENGYSKLRPEVK